MLPENQFIFSLFCGRKFGTHPSGIISDEDTSVQTLGENLDSTTTCSPPLPSLFIPYDDDDDDHSSTSLSLFSLPSVFGHAPDEVARHGELPPSVGVGEVVDEHGWVRVAAPRHEAPHARRTQIHAVR